MRLRLSIRRKLSSADLDQGSGGILMLPDQQGANPHILMQIGKEGRILVLNRDNLGGYATGVTSNTNALQDILNEAGGGLWSTPAYWNGNVYIWAKADCAQDVQSEQRCAGHDPCKPVDHLIGISGRLLSRSPRMGHRMASPGRCGRTSTRPMG